MQNALNAEDFGFSPEKCADENSAALNKACENGGEIRIMKKGTYEISDAVILKSNTTLIFGEDVYIKRTDSKNGISYVFINEGAYSHTYNENIKIIGLKLITGGIDDGKYSVNKDEFINGLRGHVSLFYVKNTVIDGFEVYDLPPSYFALHICTFSGLTIENCKIEGMKDGVHLGRGENFVIRNCEFKTFDDPIALNAHDYAISNPQLGWIENGRIENCTDMAAEHTTGYFCRMLGGAWVDWHENMVIRNSDTVVSDGKLYRAFLKPDGKEYISKTAPSFSETEKILDEIRWVKVQDEAIYSCGCRNIEFDNIYLKKKRECAFSLHFDDDNWSHSYYKGAKAPVMENIIFKRIHVENKIPILISSTAPIENIGIESSDFKKSIIVLDKIKSANPEYPIANISFKSVMFESFISDIIKCKNLRKVHFTIN